MDDSKIDWGGWPLIQVRAAADLEESPTLVGGALQAAPDRGEPFAAVVEMPGAPARRPRVRGKVEQVRMLKKLRPGLAGRCAGLAFVVPVEAQRANAKAIRAGARLWGCPTTATDDPAQARAWATDRLTAGASTPPPAGS